MRLLLFSLLLLVGPCAWSQVPLVLNGSLKEPQLDLAAYTWFYEDNSEDSLPLSVIQTKTFRPLAEKLNDKTSFSSHSRSIIWLRFTLQNSHPRDTIRLFYESGVHHTIAIYANKALIHQGGSSHGSSAGYSPTSSPSRQETLLTLPPQNTITYYVQVMDFVSSITPITSRLTTLQASLAKNYDDLRRFTPLLTAMSLLTGCLLFMSLYASFSFLLTKDRAFLYYGAYTFTASLIFFHTIDKRLGLGWLYPYYPTISPFFPAPLHPSLLTIFYGLFVIKVLNIRLQLIGKDWPLGVLFLILALQEVVSLGEAFLGRPLFAANVFYQFAIIPAGVFTLVLLAKVIQSHSPIRRFVLAGKLFLLCLTLLPVLVRFQIVNVSALSIFFKNLTSFWMQLGLVLEACCFAMALAYRARCIELEKRQIQANYMRDLEAQLEERTAQIQEQNLQLRHQYLKQLHTEFERKLADTEMIALRAQMNPHFIFNCLNSIKLYTLQNNSEQASEYLSKFARLIRLVLENSRSELVTLKHELEALQLYMELEAMRFKHKVRFSIEVSEEVDTLYLKIPPLLLQPYVENAIWHGLMHKPEGGTVTILITQPCEQLLRVEIMDDGVGREKAAQLKSKSAGKHKSFGMQVTAERIRMINHLYNTHTQIQIADLIDNRGEACGTKVLIEIPIC